MDAADSDIPQFFLYTQLNQNETKNLRKAETNYEERRCLAQIFKLKSIAEVNEQTGGEPTKVDLLKLDFHYMNFLFCKELMFSNEKVSTLLAMFDFILTRMLEQQLKPEVGLRILRDILKRHSIHRPPFQILIFSERENEQIVQFALDSFLRHYSLYEFAFKPRVDLIIRTEPVFQNKFNAPLGSLDAMELVDEDEAEKMKMFLKASSDS